MLPVTRANLDHICCVCLLDIRPTMFAEKVYDVKKEEKMSKILKLTALITVLKNPINQKYINDYCRKICEVCYLKTQYSYFFREKIIASTAVLRELLESDELSDEDIKRLQHFCRICLNRQNNLNTDAMGLSMQQMNWLKDCSGIRYTSLIDTQTFRIKEGTNINEIALINDTDFPRQLCQTCLKKLHNVEEFRKSSTQSFEYMISVMGDANGPDDDLVPQDIKQLRKNLSFKEIPQSQPVSVNRSNIKEECAIFEIDMNFKYEQEEENACTDVLECQIQDTCKIIDDPIVHKTSDCLKTEQLDEDVFENVMDLMDEITHYSDDDTGDADFTININNGEDSSHTLSDTADNSLRITRATKSKQCNKNDVDNATEGELPKNLKKVKKLKKSDEPNHKSEKCTKKVKQPKKPKITNTEVNETIICEECSHIFTTASALRRHHKTVHSPVPKHMLHVCPICSKEFKRKSHFSDHIRAVHEKQRPFKCSHCPKYFASNGSKRVHELIHTNEFPFVCEWCDKRFRLAFRLKTHLEMHTTKPELLCPICKRSQKTAKALEDHLKIHDDKRKQCPSCGKLFQKSSHLNDHYNAVHLKLRPYKCKFCESAFGDRKTRRVHEKSHTESRPETCGICNRGFKTLSSLNKHMKQYDHCTGEYSNQDGKTKKNSSKSLSQLYVENLNGVFELGSQYLGNTLTI